MKIFLKVLILCSLLLSPLFTFANDRGVAIKAKLEQDSGKKIGAYRALIIGINDYQDEKIPDLRTAVRDAKGINRVLKKSYGFADITLLLDQEANESRIVKELRRLATQTAKDDSVLIYYAGHGDLDDITGSGWWIPYNATAQDPSTYIDNSLIQKYIKAIPARHLFLISDSCFSGTLFGEARSLPKVIDDKFYASLYKNRSRWGMTSGNLTPVSDSGSAGHSVFAYQLLAALRDNTKPFFTPREIYQKIGPIIRNNSEQMPLAKPIRNADDQGGEFIFIRTDASPVKIVSATSPTQVAGADLTTVDVTFWNSIKDSDDASLFQAYLDEFPDGKFKTIVRVKLKQLSNKKGVRKKRAGIDLGIVYTENTKESFVYVKQGNMDHQYISKRLDQIFRHRFKSNANFASIEEALKADMDMILVFDLRSFPGAFAQAGTADIVGTFMDSDRQVIDYIEGSGSATLFEWGLAPALRGAFNQFLSNLNHSEKLRAFAEQPRDAAISPR